MRDMCRCHRARRNAWSTRRLRASSILSLHCLRVIVITVAHDGHVIHEERSSFLSTPDCVQGNDWHARLLSYEKLSLTPLSAGVQVGSYGLSTLLDAAFLRSSLSQSDPGCRSESSKYARRRVSAILAPNSGYQVVHAVRLFVGRVSLGMANENRQAGRRAGPQSVGRPAARVPCTALGDPSALARDSRPGCRR